MNSNEILDRKKIIEKLLILDDELESKLPSDEIIKLVIVGSSAFILQGLLERNTYDIDTYNTNNKYIEHILQKYNINDNATSIMNICNGYESRLKKLNLKTNKIQIYILGDYDLIISKLTTRPSDYADIEDSKLLERIDFDLLVKYIDTESNIFCNKDYILTNLKILKRQLERCE